MHYPGVMPSPVTLHIYDLHERIRGANAVMKKVGTGLYHGAVEVYGVEWSFGQEGDDDGPSGIFSCEPRGNGAHAYQKSIDMGQTELSQSEVATLLGELRPQWISAEYSLLHRNCCTFSNEFCKRLGVGPAPAWLSSAAGVGASAHDTIRLKPLVNTIEEGKKARGASEAEAYKFGDFTRGFTSNLASVANSTTTNVVSAGKAARGCHESERTQIGDIPRGIVSEVQTGLQKVINDGKSARDSSAESSYQFGDLTRGLVSRFARR